MIRLQIHHAYTCWEHYTFCASKQQDFCLFIDSVKSLTYTGHSKCQNDQYKDIGNQLSTTGDPRAQVIQRLWVCLVYKCSLSTCINKTNGFNRPFDGHRGCQLHIFWKIDLPQTEQSHKEPNNHTGTGNHMVQLTSELCILTLSSSIAAWYMWGQNKLVDHLLSLLSRITQSTCCKFTSKLEFK